MAGASRRGYGEDGIYFDHRDDCRDSAHHKTCSGRWRGVVSLGYAADGKRIRKKVSGQTRTEVKDKLKALHSELDAGVRTAAGYTVRHAGDRLAGRGPAGPGRQDGRGLPGCASPGARGRREDPAAGPDRAGRPHRAGDDGGHPFHADAAEGAQLPDPGPAPRRGPGSRSPQRLGAGRHPARPRGPAVAGADCGAGGGAAGGGGGLAAARVHRAMPADRRPVGGSAGADMGSRGPGRQDDLGVAVGPRAR